MEELNVKLPDEWKSWELKECIGQGAFGRVYRAEKTMTGFVTVSAIKIIDIPKDSSEVDSFLQAFSNQRVAEKLYSDIVNEYIKEIQYMESLRGITNIVSIEDYYLEHQEGELQWHIFIRMEYLESLKDYQISHVFHEDQIIKLGIDLCTALSYCERESIIHRDIKPENVFVSPAGDFKLGDFGVARTVDQTIGSYSTKGTYYYMAPEIYNGKEYGKTVDIYSVGIILYRLLNQGRVPFVDPEKQLIGAEDLNNALKIRMSGAEPPLPVDASPELAAVIQKAIAYHPEDRYPSADSFRIALERVRLKQTESGNQAFPWFQEASSETMQERQNPDLDDFFSPYDKQLTTGRSVPAYWDTQQVRGQKKTIKVLVFCILGGVAVLVVLCLVLLPEILKINDRRTESVMQTEPSGSIESQSTANENIPEKADAEETVQITEMDQNTEALVTNNLPDLSENELTNVADPEPVTETDSADTVVPGIVEETGSTDTADSKTVEETAGAVSQNPTNEQLLRNPETYLGTELQYNGQAKVVTYFNDGSLRFCFYVDKPGDPAAFFTSWYEIVFIVQDSSLLSQRILQNDQLDVRGTFTGIDHTLLGDECITIAPISIIFEGKELLPQSSTYVAEPVGASETIYTDSQTVLRVQQLLYNNGYIDVRADGSLGPVTSAAIKDFQLNRGLEVTGQITDSLIEQLENASSGLFVDPFADIW